MKLKKIDNNLPELTETYTSSMGMRARLILGFGTITLVFLIAIATTLVIVTSTKNYSNQVITTDLPVYSALLDLGSEVHQSQYSLGLLLLKDDPNLRNEFDAAWTNIARLEQTLDQLVLTWTTADASKQWDLVKASLEQLKSEQIKIENFVAAKNSVAAQNEFFGAAIPLTNKVLDILDGKENANGERVGGIYDLQYAQLKEGTQTILTDMSTAQTVGYTVTVLGILVTIAIAIFTARSILRHINMFRQYSSRIASGDLRHYLAIEGKDEIGQLGVDLNKMTESLATITKQITQACQNMVTTLEEVKQAVDVQSTGATEQASSINQITASLEEIEKSSSQTMDKAKSLGESAEKTREKGQQGLEAVEQSIHGMKAVREKVQVIAQTILELSNQTQQVGEITTVVNTLAQQSKMLALNASIEAAKAGEAGKGFAVVASEVKNLAEQSEQSTSQVQKILEDIRRATEKAVMATEEGTKGVDEGTSLVEQTGDIVRNLSDVIRETTIATQQIEAAVRQEGVGIEQITAGMNEINQVTSSFVVSANQTLEAINNLSGIAKNLKEHVDTYQT